MSLSQLVFPLLCVMSNTVCREAGPYNDFPPVKSCIVHLPDMFRFGPMVLSLDIR